MTKRKTELLFHHLITLKNKITMWKLTVLSKQLIISAVSLLIIALLLLIFEWDIVSKYWQTHSLMEFVKFLIPVFLIGGIVAWSLLNFFIEIISNIIFRKRNGHPLF